MSRTHRCWCLKVDLVTVCVVFWVTSSLIKKHKITCRDFVHVSDSASTVHCAFPVVRPFCFIFHVSLRLHEHRMTLSQHKHIQNPVPSHRLSMSPDQGSDDMWDNSVDVGHQSHRCLWATHSREKLTKSQHVRRDPKSWDAKIIVDVAAESPQFL